MSDGGNKRWWSQPKNAVVPWTAAAFGLLLATAFGIAAGIQCLELQSHHLVIPTDNKGPNWAEIANLFLASTLAIVAILALGTIRQARHARIEAQTAQNALQMNELSRRWDDEVNRQVRTKVREYAKKWPSATIASVSEAVWRGRLDHGTHRSRPTEGMHGKASGRQ
jgi:hypothetical protein